MHNIVVEINPSMEGVNRQVAGVFFRDERGSVFLGHTGRVGGGKPGIGRDAFLSFSNARLTEINAPDGKPLAAILIGEIGAPEFCQKLCSFIKKVAEFKGTIS